MGEEGGMGSFFVSGCIPDCAEDPCRHTKPELAAAAGSSHAARQPTSGTQDPGGEQEQKNIQGGGWEENTGRTASRAVLPDPGKAAGKRN